MFDALHIIIPVYNEGENIAKTLSEIESRITTPHSILIVYDFDEDNTLPTVNEIFRERNAGNVFPVKNRYGKVVLNGIKTGFDSTKDGVVLVVMAHSSDDLSIMDACLKRSAILGQSGNCAAIS